MELSILLNNFVPNIFTMATIDLTKQEVVDVLAEFEERLPNIGTELFQPDPNITMFDLANINREASRMLRFMHLDGYVPVVRLTDLSGKSAAGQAYMGDNSDGVFEIDIDNRIMHDYRMMYRVLAHELCHKYLEIHGLYSKVLPKLDEVRAELCTIFMGFGLQVLNGYTETSGYLNLEDFCHAFCVVYLSRGMTQEQIRKIVPESCKTYVDNILSDINKLESQKLSEMIIANQSADYELRHRMRALQLVYENMTDISEKHKSFDKIFRNKQKELSDGNHPILNMLLRETMAIKALDDKRFKDYCVEIDKLIAKICQLEKVDIANVSAGLSKDITCPACGYVNSSTVVDGLKALKCPQCHHYFVWDGRPLELKPSDNKEKKGFWRKIFKKNSK